MQKSNAFEGGFVCKKAIENPPKNVLATDSMQRQTQDTHHRHKSWGVRDSPFLDRASTELAVGCPVKDDPATSAREILAGGEGHVSATRRGVLHQVLVRAPVASNSRHQVGLRRYRSLARGRGPRASRRGGRLAYGAWRRERRGLQHLGHQ